MNKKDTEIAEMEEYVVYNGYIPGNIPSYKKEDINYLVSGESYKVLEIALEYGEYTWYRIENNGYKIWYPSISFDRINKYIKKKYGLR